MRHNWRRVRAARAAMRASKAEWLGLFEIATTFQPLEIEPRASRIARMRCRRCLAVARPSPDALASKTHLGGKIGQKIDK